MGAFATGSSWILAHRGLVFALFSVLYLVALVAWVRWLLVPRHSCPGSERAQPVPAA